MNIVNVYNLYNEFKNKIKLLLIFNYSIVD